jgi:hypothetical protein
MSKESIQNIVKLLELENIIKITDNQTLHGMLIPREQLIDDIMYEKIKINIPKLKQFFSSSYMTALQSNADKQQRWPLLNLVRQLLCAFNYKLIPKRICDGYTSDGKKKYKRMFVIETQIISK